MGNSRFRLSHVMPNVWFYKLADIGRFRESRRRLLQARNSTKIDYCTSLPRSSSYHFGSTEGVCNSPGKDKAKRADIEHKQKTSAKGKKNKRFSFTFIDSTISAGCICTATVDSIWKSREIDDSSSASSSESEEPATYHTKSPVLDHQINVDRSHLDPQLEPRNKNHGLHYGYKNYVAGLPSPVREYGDVGHENLRHVQALVRRVEEVFELVPDPFMMDTTITCSTSCSRRLSSSSSTTDEISLLSNEGEIQEDYFSSMVMEVKQRQRFVQDLEERRPSMIRPNAELHNGRGHEKQKQISDKNSVPTSKNRSKFQSAGQKQVSVSITSFNSTSAAQIRAPTRVGKDRNQISNKADKTSTRFSSSSKPRCPDFRSKSVPGKRGDCRPCISSTNQKSKPKVESERAPKPVNKYQVFTSANSNSFAVVKSSSDPQKDFRESMVEMVKENNIRYSRDFQELLRCYLSLNSDEYHDIIKKAFEQVRSGLRKNRK